MALGKKALVAAALLLAVAACGSEPAVEADEPTATAPPHRLLGMVWGRQISWGFRGGELVRLDPRSLAAIGPRVPLRRSVSFGWSFSPGRDTLVFGGLDASLRFVDVRRVRRVADVDLGGRGTVVASAWPTPRRVLVAVQRPYGGGALRLVIVDPITRRVLARRPLAGRSEVMDVAASSRGLALLLAAPNSVGPSGLVVVGTDGGIRSAGIDAIAAGTKVVRRGGHPVQRRWFPGLAVDPAGRRAFVVGGEAQLAEFDLETMRVVYRRPTVRVSLIGRLREWLEPYALAKGESEGPVRSVRWLGDGLLAVSGWDARGTEPPTAAGVRVIDTRSWTARTVAPDAGRFTLAGDVLLAHGCCFAGLSAYERDGRRLWHRYGREAIHDVEVFGNRVYVYRYVRGGDRIDVLDLGTGRTDRSLESPRFQLMDPRAGRWPPR